MTVNVKQQQHFLNLLQRQNGIYIYIYRHTQILAMVCGSFKSSVQ